MNNSANENSLAAEKAGLSYWEYMEKQNSGCVQHFVWGVKKMTRKEERTMLSKVGQFLAKSNLPGMKLLGHIRKSVRKQSAK